MARTAPLLLAATLLGCGGTSSAPGAPALAAHAASVPGAQAAGKGHGPAAPSCVLPWGPNLNELLGTDLEIITGEGGCDTVIAAHRRFAQLLVFWFNSPGGSPEVPLLYPPGYTPHDPDPMKDFLTRLKAASYVEQPSGRTFTFTARQLRHDFYPSTIGSVFGGSGQFPDAWNGLRTLVMLPPLPGLRPGSYSVGVSVTFAGGWCDGTSNDISTCLPAGTTFLYSREFTAVAGCGGPGGEDQPR